MAVKFGKECWEKYFMLGEGWVHLNHGAFGTIPRTVFAAYTELLAQVEVSPDKWFVYDQYGMVRCSRERLAGLINCSPEEVVLVENATTGVNTVLRSLQLHEGDGLLITSLSYPGVSNTAIAVCQQSGATLHTLEVPFPIESKESVVQLYRSYLDAHPDVKVAVVDHISSPAPILQPVKEVAEVCHKRGVKVLVDGAHGPGQLHLDMRELDVDYYTGNLHKWLLCPRGCALLFVREELKESIHPVVVTHQYFDGFETSFSRRATRDSAPFCMVPHALDFIEDSLGGFAPMREYNSSLASWAADMLSQQWSEPKLAIPGPRTEKYGTQVAIALYKQHQVAVAVNVVAGELWCRISAQVYNTREDYLHLASAMEKLARSPPPQS